MAFYSILFPTPEDEAQAKDHSWLSFRMDEKRIEKYAVRGNKVVLTSRADAKDAPMRPGLYLDLNVDQIMEEVLCHDADECLTDIFYHLCPNSNCVLYRQDVMRTLEDLEAAQAFRSFLQSFVQAERLLGYGRLAHHNAQRDKYLLDGAVMYSDALRQLIEQTAGLNIRSKGLASFLNAAQAYIQEMRFIQLEEKAKRAKGSLERISYALRLCDGSLYVDFEPDDTDYTQALYQDFDLTVRWGENAQEKQMEILPFRQMELAPLEALVVDALLKKHKKTFDDARMAAQEVSILPEPFLARFSKELRFYFLYLDTMVKLRVKGYDFAYPELNAGDDISLTDAYDMALAICGDTVVANDFILQAGERCAVVTGANQGGKTTFARSIGQIAVLASLGLPVPCNSARLPLYSAIFSQFTKAEDATADNGKLMEELQRLKAILSYAGGKTLVILNELFSSATAQDALDMAGRTLEMLNHSGARTVFVTHIDGLRLSNAASLVAQVQKENGKRTYKIVRADADGHAYAHDIARRYRLTALEIGGRIAHGV